MIAVLLLAHGLVGVCASPVTLEGRPERCLWANDGACDEPDLCPAASDAADCGTLLGEASTPAELNRRAMQEGGQFVVSAGPCTLSQGGSCVGRADGYTHSETCSITSTAPATMTFQLRAVMAALTQPFGTPGSPGRPTAGNA